MNKPLSADKIRQIQQLAKEGFNKEQIAKKLGLNRSTVLKYKNWTPPEEAEPVGAPKRPGQIVNRLALDGTIEMTFQGKPPTPEEFIALCGVDLDKWVPVSYKPVVWQGFHKTNDGGHEKVQLVATRMTFKSTLTEGTQEAIMRFVKAHVKPAPLQKKGKALPPVGEKGFLVVAGLWDSHIGMYAWKDEVGADYDVEIASARIKNAIDDLTAELSVWPIARMIIPVGNDLMHYDSVRHKTAHGEHFLDTDTRYARVFQAALTCIRYQIDRALEVCDDILIPYIPGNHDYTSSYCICAAIDCWYRNDSRVKVDLSANPRKYYRHGGVLLGFEHGTDCKPETLARIFATEAAADWSASTYREVQIGHKHQNREWHYEGVTPTNGVTVRMNPALTSTDVWHHGKGFVGQVKAVEAWRYDSQGYRGSHCVWARDDQRSAKK